MAYTEKRSIATEEMRDDILPKKGRNERDRCYRNIKEEGQMKYVKYVTLVFVGFFLILSCETAPITGRTSLSLVSDTELNTMSFTQYKEFMTTHKLSGNCQQTQQVKKVGHEIAHAVARHGNERMSQGLLVQLGGAALTQALTSQPTATQQLFLGVFGMGAQVGVLLPYSRLQESEADRLGLIFMAMAGYDPNGAIPLWQRMASKQKGTAPPEFLSTHPADETRINNIRTFIPEAMRYRRS
jgi:hypothetical protein